MIDRVQREALLEAFKARPNFVATPWLLGLSDDELAAFARDCAIEVVAGG